MRSNLLVGISSAVAAVAVAGSASAGIAPSVIDNFASSYSLTGDASNGGEVFSGGAYGSPIGFSQRNVDIFSSNANSGRVLTWDLASSGSGWAIATRTAGGTGTFTSTRYAGFSITYSGTSLDMSDAESFSVSYSGNTLGSNALASAFMTVTVYTGTAHEYTKVRLAGTPSGTISFNKSSFGALWGVVNWSSINQIILGFELDALVGAPTNSSLGSITLTNFSYVPAPGAAALVGVAGLLSARRRKA